VAAGQDGRDQQLDRLGFAHDHLRDRAFDALDQLGVPSQLCLASRGAQG
jgi:hypothetical protein